MRFTRMAAVLAVVPVALAAQQTARPDAPNPGTLEAEVHYATGGDAWFSTNKPAYVALFDVSRGGVTQLYPTFSAQATELSGTSVRVDMRSAPALPQAAAIGGSSLVTLNTPTASAGWPHTLLLVASTMPLRVGSTWDSNIAINNDLVRNHQWNSLDTDAGIAAVVNLVRPQDWGAEVATDRAQLATPAQYASALDYDPTKTAIGYSCVNGVSQFTSLTPVLGASCVPVTGFPSHAGAVNAAIITPSAGGIDTVRAPLQSRAVQTAPTASRISEQKHADVQSISDPNEIRKFMESMKAGQATQGASDGTTAPRSNHQHDGMPSSERSGGMSHQNADGSPSRGGSAGGPPHNDQAHDAHPRVEEQAKPQPAAPSSSTSSAPIKPANERD